MLIVVGDVYARDGRFDALFAAGLAHSRRSRAEPGCITHECYADPERPGRLFLFERWEDRAALDAHFITPGTAEFLAAAAEHAAQPGDIGIYVVSQG